MPARISLPLKGGGNPGFPGHLNLMAKKYSTTGEQSVVSMPDQKPSVLTCLLRLKRRQLAPFIAVRLLVPASRLKHLFRPYSSLRGIVTIEPEQLMADYIPMHLAAALPR
jgi:hypothetical protein